MFCLTTAITHTSMQSERLFLHKMPSVFLSAFNLRWELFSVMVKGES